MTSKRMSAALGALATILLCLGLLAPTTAFAQDDAQKLDQVTMRDGRQFTGNILEETDTTLTMEIIFRGITTTREFQKREVIEVLYDTIKTERPVRNSDEDVRAASPDVPVRDLARGRRVVHVLPLRGLIGWQVYKPNVRRLFDEAIEAGVETIVLEYDCYDGFSGGVVDEYRDFFTELKREAEESEVELVVWMKNAIGPAVAYALMFEEIYFHPDGVMGRGEILDDLLKDRFDDEAVQAKMISAAVSTYRSMAEQGGHDALLCEAMIRPEKRVGVRFEGERPVFSETPEQEGYTPLDTSETEALELDAAQAVRFGIAKGKRGGARTIRDVMDELNYREYYIYEGEAEEFNDAWLEGYEQAFDDYREILKDIQQYDSWDIEIKRKLGMKLQKYREVQRLLRRFPPLGTPPYTEALFEGYHYGLIDPFQLEFLIDDLKRQIQSINEQTGRGGGGGRGGRGGGGGG